MALNLVINVYLTFSLKLGELLSPLSTVEYIVRHNGQVKIGVPFCVNSTSFMKQLFFYLMNFFSFV